MARCLKQKLRDENTFQAVQTRKGLVLAKWAVTLYRSANLVLKLIYLYETQTMRSPNLIMRLAGIEYELQNPSDPNASLWQRMTAMTPLATIMFALRFVQWWQQQEADYSSSSLSTVDINSIPPMPIPSADHSSLYKDLPGRCPICQDRIKEPTSLETGRVFCRSCLHQEKLYKNESKCPVTLRPVNKVHERRLIMASMDE